MATFDSLFGSFLKKLAHKMDPIVHIGKNGLTDSVIQQIDEILENRELIKVKLLESSLLDAKETGIISSHTQLMTNGFDFAKPRRQWKRPPLGL